MFFATVIAENCWSQVANPEITKRSVVHLETDDGTCNGILLNNTNEDGKALILTAGHCLTDENRFLSVIFGRDYVLNDTKYRNVEWRSTDLTLQQLSRDLDYALFEVTGVIPEYILPYYAGWEVINDLPISSYGIHSPGIEKVFIEDLNRPKRATFNGITEFGGTPVNNGTLNIIRWEIGFTTEGSSGSPLFNQSSLVTGILSGGASSEANPTNDFYSRFDLIYQDGISDWLNPTNENRSSIAGMDFQQKANNLFKNVNYQISNEISEITDTDFIAEIFQNEGSSIVKGIYLTLNEIIPTDLFTISILSDGVIVYENSVFSGSLNEFSENFIPINEIVEVGPEYTIQIQHNRSLKFPVTISEKGTINLNENQLSNRSLLIGVLSEGMQKVSEPISLNEELIYPNPSTQNFYIQQGNSSQISDIKLFTPKGNEVVINTTEDYLNRVVIDMTGHQKGLYILQYRLEKQVITEKLLLI